MNLLEILLHTQGLTVTHFKGYTGPKDPHEHVMLHVLEGVQFNVQLVQQV